MLERLMLKNVKLYPAWSNFSGAETRHTPAGHRYFLVLLSSDDAARAESKGLKVHHGPDGLSIKIDFPLVRYGEPVNPTTVWGTVTSASNHRQWLYDSNVQGLAFADGYADVTMLLWPWEFQGRSGVKPYVQSLDITLI